MEERTLELKKMVDFFNPPQDTLYVCEKDSMREALTIMMGYDFSQILVVRQRSSVGLKSSQIVGCLSWASIGRKCMNRSLNLEDPVNIYGII